MDSGEIKFSAFFPDHATIAKKLIRPGKRREVFLGFPRGATVIVVIGGVRVKKVEIVTHHDAIGVEFIRSDFFRSRSASGRPAIHAHQIHVRDGNVAPLVGFRSNILRGSPGHAGAPVNAAAFEIGLIAI